MNGVKVFDSLTLSIALFVIVTHYYYSPSRQPKDKHFEEEEEQVELEEEVKVSWAELDRNLLGEIVSRLCLTDQARFRAVCNNWLAAAHPIINANATKSSLPWHGCQFPGSAEFQIYDPLSSPNHLASRHIIPWSKLGIQSSSAVALHTVKHNWVFLSIAKSKLFFSARWYVLLFSPLTKTIITLPKFDYRYGFKFVSTFSTRPDSPDCVFCMVDANRYNQIAVLTYHNGYKEWTARQFNMHPNFRRSFCRPQIIRGILYIHSPFGQVASYNIFTKEFSFDCLLHDEFIIQNSRSRIMKSFVLNGELMILGFNKDMKNDASLPGQQFVRSYDRSRKVWIPVRTLADYALFFSKRIIEVSLINTKNTTCNGVLSNKVYRFFDGGCRVYSLEDGILVPFKSINSNFLEDGGADLPEYKYNYGIPDTGVAYWLEAPRVRSSSDNQEVRCFRDTRESKGIARALG